MASGWTICEVGTCYKSYSVATYFVWLLYELKTLLDRSVCCNMSTFLHAARDTVARSLSPSSDAPHVTTPTIPKFEPREAPASITGGSHQSSDFSWDSEALGLPPHPDDPTASHVSGGSTPRRRDFASHNNEDIVRDVSFASGGSFGARIHHYSEAAHAHYSQHPQNAHGKTEHRYSEQNHQQEHVDSESVGTADALLSSHTPHVQALASNFTRASISATTRRLQQAQSIEGQLRRQLHSNDELFHSLANEHAEIQAQLAALRAASVSTASKVASSQSSKASAATSRSAESHSAGEGNRYRQHPARSTPLLARAESSSTASSASTGSAAARLRAAQSALAADARTHAAASIDTSAPTASAMHSVSRGSAHSQCVKVEEEGGGLSVGSAIADTTAPTATSDTSALPSSVQDDHVSACLTSSTATETGTGTAPAPAVAVAPHRSLHVQLGRGGQVRVQGGDVSHTDAGVGTTSDSNIWSSTARHTTAHYQPPAANEAPPPSKPGGAGSPGIQYLLRRGRSGRHSLGSPSLLHFALKQRGAQGGSALIQGDAGGLHDHAATTPAPSHNTTLVEQSLHSDTVRAVNGAVRAIADAVRGSWAPHPAPEPEPVPALSVGDTSATASTQETDEELPPSSVEDSREAFSSAGDSSSVSTAGSLRPDVPPSDGVVQASLQVAPQAPSDSTCDAQQPCPPADGPVPAAVETVPRLQYPVTNTARQAFALFPHPHYEWYNVRADALPSDVGRISTSDVVRPAAAGGPIAPGHVQVTHPPPPSSTTARDPGMPATSVEASSSEQYVSHATYRDALRSAEAMFLTLRSLGVEAAHAESCRGAGDGAGVEGSRTATTAVRTRDAIRRDKALHAKRVRGAQSSEQDKAAVAWRGALNGVPSTRPPLDKHGAPMHPLDAVLQNIPDPLVPAAPDVTQPLPGMHQDKHTAEAMHLGDLFAPDTGSSGSVFPQWVQRARGVSAREPSPAAVLRADALHGAVAATENPRALAAALASVLQEVCSELGATRVADAVPRLRRCVSAAQQLPALKRFSSVVCDTVGNTLVAQQDTQGTPAVGLEEALHVLRDALPRRGGAAADLSPEELRLLRGHAVQ